MSWQDYVDNQLLASQCVSKAAIAGHDGGVWAKSEGFEVSTCQIYCLKNCITVSLIRFVWNIVLNEIVLLKLIHQELIPEENIELI